MRLVWLTCVYVLVLACDRGSAQPVSPSRPMPTKPAVPVAAEVVSEVPVVRVDAELPTAAPEPEPEPPNAVESNFVDEGMPTEPAREVSENPELSDLTGECCRTCRKGKACGDTCVARDRECTVAPGCACDAEPAQPLR